jgi:uncharacterized protein (DUF2249 family)
MAASVMQADGTNFDFRQRLRRFVSLAFDAFAMHLQEHSMNAPATVNTIDVRDIAPRQRHPLIFSTFAGLPDGQAMQLVNDHDPKPLYYQFAAELPGRFGWDYLETGPDVWRVAITKLAAPHGEGNCCGTCGGQ